MAPLFCRALQTCLKQALEADSQDYQSPAQLSTQAKEDLQWWELHLSNWNGRSLISQQSSMTIISNASLQGWGAFCNGVRTRDPWSPQEQTLHTNCLELLAASIAVRTFTKERSGITILLKIDNTTAVAYINRMGGTASPTLSQLTKNLRLWCMGRNILSQARHLPCRSIELHCRQGVEDLVRQIRMETQSNTVPENQHTSGTSLNRSVCQQAVNSAPEFCQLEARSTGNGSGCFHSGLGEHPREIICQSPMELGRQSPVSSSQPDSGGTGSSSTSLESTVVVSNVAPVVNQQATSHSLVSTSNPVSVSEQSSRHNAPISRVGCIRDRCQSGNFQTQLQTLSCLHAWRDKSTRSYNSSFNKWARWCAELDRNWAY